MFNAYNVCEFNGEKSVPIEYATIVNMWVLNFEACSLGLYLFFEQHFDFFLLQIYMFISMNVCNMFKAYN